MQVRHVVMMLAGACGASSAIAQDYNYSVRQFSDEAATNEIAVSYSTASATTVAVLSATARIRILAQGTNYDIGRVTLSSSSTQTTLTMVSVGNAFGVYDDPVTVPTGNSWRGIDVSATTFPNARFYGGITGNLTGDVEVPALRRLEVGGVIEAGADVLVHSRTTTEPYYVVSESVSGTAPVPRLWLYEGDIERVQTSAGNMGGEVRAVHGSIKNVVVAGDLTGRVLAVGGATTQSPPDTSVVARIENIAVDGDITAQPFCWWDNGGC